LLSRVGGAENTLSSAIFCEEQFLVKVESMKQIETSAIILHSEACKSVPVHSLAICCCTVALHRAMLQAQEN
jgi:hypothetical protein